MKNVNAKTFWMCIFAGIVIRFGLINIGYNFDFESYCIVGEIAAAGKNVYANTGRYNYAPIWFTLLGLFWKISSYFTHNILVFRCFIVGTLTLGDFFITQLISKKAGNFWGIIFFLNPISLIITGYHHQFDNLAVMLGAYAVSCIEKSCHEQNIRREDICGVLLLSLSLITKHIMWAFPLWVLLSTKINLRKKFLYAFIPPILFLLSFTPYLSEGRNQIYWNVFTYRSFNDFPLFGLSILNSWGITIPTIFHKYYRYVFGVLMLAGGCIFRREDIYKSFLLYTITLVCVSSAMANQYLAIPCMALILLCWKQSILYFVLSGVFLSCSFSGLNIFALSDEVSSFEGRRLLEFISTGDFMNSILVWCLLYCLVSYCRKNLSR